MTASPSPSAPLRLLAVHAHPDDESSKGAATMAMYAASGVDVLVATCTDGSRGDIQNPAMEGQPHPQRDMAGARRLEMDAAAKVLGVRQRWLGFVDSGLPEGDPLPPLPAGCFALQPLERAAAPLVRLVRDFKPHVILSYDENGGYPHPDHIMAHRVAVEAFAAAGDPERYPGIGEPWAPSKLYYDRAFSPGPLPRAALCAGRGRPAVPVCRAAGRLAGSGCRRAHPAAADAPHHHPDRVRGLLRGPRRGAPFPPHPGGPGRILLRGIRGHAAQGLAVGGLLPDRVPDPGRRARNGPVCRAKIDGKGLFYPV